MDILDGNQVQVDEKDERKELPVEESLFSYSYNHHFEHPEDFNRESVDTHLSKWPDLELERLLMMQEGGLDLSSSSSKPQAKRRKTEDIREVHGGGCRIIRPAGRKDCHSKVSTARGTRDRRLRLSPKTAIQFYDVQDRLGYDRPSKAIDWLMKEAKTAIDALDNKSPPAAVAACDKLTESYDLLPNGSFLKSENDNAVISSLGFFTNDDFNSPLRSNYEGPEDISSICHGNYHEEDGILSANSWEIFDPNLEMCRMQMFSQREPLQSSYSRINANYSPLISTQFPGFCFSNEETQSLSAAATLKVDEMDKIPASSEPFSAASFLSYEK